MPDDHVVEGRIRLDIPPRSDGTKGPGTIDWIHVETFEPIKRMAVGTTPRGASFTREGISLWKDQLFLMPEDGYAKIYVFDMKPIAPARN